MRKSTLLLLSVLAIVALPSYGRDRSHSYFTYDDGGTTIRQSEDGRDVEARVNMPVFPGDEVTTGRRGRVEIRMADGNIIALDRSTSIQFKSILDSYDGDSDTDRRRIEIRPRAIQRDDETGSSSSRYRQRELRRDRSGELRRRNRREDKDRVTVFDGTMEVRTPARTTRIREGEEARVDDGGIYGLVSDAQHRRRIRALVHPARIALQHGQRPLSRSLARVLRVRAGDERVMGLCRELRRLVLASARRRRLASVLQRLLAAQPGRRAGVGFVRSVGLGAVSLRPLGV